MNNIVDLIMCALTANLIDNRKLYNTDNRVARLDMRNLPSASQAVGMYHQEGGRISDETGFGEDPLLGDNAKGSIRTQAFCERYPSYDAIFHELVNSANPLLFKDALIFYIDVTYH